MKYLHLVATAATGLLLMLGSLDMPDTGDPASPPSLHVSPRYIEQGFEETAVPNMVTAVLADYRSFDTLGEVTVVFTAEVNAGGGWFAVPGSLPVDAPSVSVKLFEVDTVLTNGDCMANPSAAGCG